MLPVSMISTAVLRAQPDDRLVKLAASGSEAAFEAIVQRYRRPLLAYCRRLLIAESRSEDVVQQALLSAWCDLTGGAQVRDLRPWLYRITHNHAMSVLRRPGYELAELRESLCGLDAPEHDLERRILMRETLAAVAGLPRRQREAILRTAVDGQSYEEVAAALGVSDAAVRGLLNRARTSLRAAVAAVAPWPVVVWAASNPRRWGALPIWVAETLAGGGSAGGAAVLLKGVAVIASSAAVVGGTVGKGLDPRRPPSRASVSKTTSHARSRPAPSSGSSPEPSASAGRVVFILHPAGAVGATSAHPSLVAEVSERPVQHASKATLLPDAVTHADGNGSRNARDGNGRGADSTVNASHSAAGGGRSSRPGNGAATGPSGEARRSDPDCAHASVQNSSCPPSASESTDRSLTRSTEPEARDSTHPPTASAAPSLLTLPTARERDVRVAERP